MGNLGVHASFIQEYALINSIFRKAVVDLANLL